MKRAVLLHGTDGSPDHLWFPWLKTQLVNSGYTVYAPLLPNNHTPDRDSYSDFLKRSDWDFKDNIVIGHSSGATTVLNLLLEDWFPSLRAAVLIGAFLNERLLQYASPDWYDSSQFIDLFRQSYPVQDLLSKSQKFVFVHGSDDPYCDIRDARRLCDGLHGSFVTIEGGGHLASSSGVTELPQLIEQLKIDKLL